ncbi:MAG: metalloregulator ArsR/SmtB family transcription factor [Bacteroidales bacterium]
MSTFAQIDPGRIDIAANMMRAIANPMRLAILGYLSEGEEFNVTEIHRLAHIEQSTASHHLGILKDKGILNSRREGKNTYYSLKNRNFKKLMECVSNCACFNE